MNISNLLEAVKGNGIERLAELLENDLKKPYKEAKKEFLKDYFSDLLLLNLGNVSRVASTAQINRRHVYRLLDELELDAEEWRKMIKPSYYYRETLQQTIDEMPELVELSEEIEDISEELSIAERLPFHDALGEFERQYIVDALKKTNFDIDGASRILDMSQRTLYRKISKLGIAVT